MGYTRQHGSIEPTVIWGIQGASLLRYLNYSRYIVLIALVYMAKPLPTIGVYTYISPIHMQNDIAVIMCSDCCCTARPPVNNAKNRQGALGVHIISSDLRRRKLHEPTRSFGRAYNKLRFTKAHVTKKNILKRKLN